MAFRELSEQYQFSVYQLVNGFVGDRKEADEIAQKVFVEAYFSARRGDARSCSCARICRIALNDCYGFLRKKRLKRSYKDDTAKDDTAANATSAAVPQDPCLKPDRGWRDLPNTRLERLLGDDRYLLVLREVGGYSPAQLSEITRISETNIRGRLFRARQRLAEEFWCDAFLSGKS